MPNRTLWHVLPPTWSISLAWRENMHSKREKARPPVTSQTINPTYVGQRRAISVYGCQPQWQATTTVAYLYGRPGFLSVARGGSVLNITSAGTRSASYARRITRWPGKDREARRGPRVINGRERERERDRQTDREGERERGRKRERGHDRNHRLAFLFSGLKHRLHQPPPEREREKEREKERGREREKGRERKCSFTSRRLRKKRSSRFKGTPLPTSEAKGCISQLCFYSRFFPKSPRRFRLFALMSRSILRVVAVGSSWVETIRS